MWDPGNAEWNQILADAQLIAAGLLAYGEPPGYVAFVPGSAGVLMPLPVFGAAVPAAEPGPGGAIAPGVPAPAVAGGLPPAVAAAAGAGAALGPAQSMEMKNMASALEELQVELAKMASGGASSSSKKDKKKKDKKAKKKSKKKKKKSGDSSSSSSRSRSRSSSSQSGSSDSEEGPLKWKRKAKSRRVPLKKVMHIEGQKFKKRGDLVAYAAKHPGALTAHFLSGIYAKVHKGAISESKSLRDVNVAAWASAHTGLTETRDLREVANIAAAMDAVQRDEIASALDILAQRVVSIQNAKKAGGKWEKAELIELISPSGSGLASGGMLSLMGSS